MQHPEEAGIEFQCRQTLRDLGVLDTFQDERFDRLTRIARRHFGVSVALVSLVDTERRWCKSRQGLDVQETPRAISFCDHAILGEAILKVPDTLEDDRFANNPLVTAPPHIRFYAGAPLHAPDGERVGTFCILDNRPRTFSDDELSVLRDLADIVEAELEREAQYRDLVEGQTESIQRFLPDTTIVFANHALANLLGCVPDDLSGKRWIDMLPEEEKDGALAELDRFRPQDPVRSFENSLVLETGEVRRVLWTTRAFFDGAGQVTHFQSVGTDVTERRKIEEGRIWLLEIMETTEKRWRFVLEATEQGVWDWDVATDTVYFSPQWKWMLGHEEYEIGDSLDEWKERVHPDDLTGTMADLDRHFRGETEVYENEHRVRCKDGSYKWILDRGRVVKRDSEGKPLRVIGSHTDITERRQLFESLQEQEKRFRTLFELYPDATLLIDPGTGLPVQFNETAHEQLGYTAAEFAGLRITDYEAQETPEETAEHIRTILEQGRDDFETRHRRKDGSIVDVRVSVVLLDQEDRNLFLAVFRDISQQKQALRELAESEKRFMDVAEAAGEYIWEVTPKGRYRFVTPQAGHLLGYEADDIIGHSPFEFMPPEEARRVEGLFAEWAAEKTSWQGLEHVSLRPDGRLVHQRVSGLPILGESGELLGFRGTGRDITAEKEAEQAKEVLTERLHLATSAAGLGIWDYDIASGRLDWDEGMFRLYGVDPADFSHRFEDWDRALVGESRDQAKARFQAAVESGSQFEASVTIRRADDGTLRTLHSQAQVIRNDAGKVVRVVGVNRDITSQEENRRQLAAEEAKFRDLFELSPVGIAMNDFATGAFLEFNDAIKEPAGYTREEFKALSYWEVTPEEYMADEQAMLEAMERTGRYGPFQKEYIRKDGSRYPVLLHGFKTTTSEGREVIWSIIQDISDIERTRHELEAARNQFASLVNNIPGTTFRCKLDRDWTMSFLSKGVDTLTGFDASDFTGNAVRSYASIIHPDDAAMIDRSVAEACAADQPWEINYRVRHRDGSIRWAQERGMAVRDDLGEVAYLDGHILDITGQKTAEARTEAIETEIRKHRAAVDAIAHTIAAEDRVQPILSETCRNLGEALGADQTLVYDIDFDQQRVIGQEEWLNPARPDISPSIGTLPLAVFGDGIRHLREQRTWLTSHADAVHPALTGDGSAEVLHEQMNIGTMLWYPFSFRDGGYHLLVLNWLERQPEPNEQQQGFLASVAGLVQLAQNKLRVMEQQQRVQKQYETLFVELQEGFALHEIICDDEGRPTDYRFLAVNPAFERLTGQKADEVVGRRVRELMPATESYWIEHFGHVALTGENHTIEGYSADLGRYFRAVAFQPEPGQFASLITDITERRNAEQQLAQNKAQLDAFFTQSFSGFFFMMLDEPVDWKGASEDDKAALLDYAMAHQRMTKVNQAMLDQYGAREEDFIGLTVNGLFAHDLDYGRSIWEGLLDQGRWHGETREQRLDGTPIIIDGDYICLYDAQDRIIGHFGVQHDITERKRQEEALEQAREEAERANRAKSDFLANMSHEIRTPMNAVIGMSQLLQTFQDQRQRDLVNKIYHSSRMLLGIINDILDFSKVESGQLELEEREFELTKVIDQMATFFGQEASSKGLELLFDIPPDLPQTLVGDSLRLSQVLTNLLSNATKFTDQGGVVELGIGSVEPAPRGHVTLDFRVRDSGIGISEEQRPRIFRPFSQADSSTTRRFGGTGLGLAISQQLVVKMGGELEVESEPGRGSTFSFTLTLPVGPGSGRTVECPETQGNRVLIVDDYAHARQVMREFLRYCGYETEEASSGEEAIEKVLAAEAGGSPFNFILLDWHMPAGMNGGETCRELQRRRQQGELKHTPPHILMVSAYARDEVEFDFTLVKDFLPKPLTASTLYDALARAERGESAVPHGPPAAMVPDLAGREILLVEDNETNQEVATLLLEKTGATVRLAENGARAVDAVAERVPDLILMDLQMPVMDGFEATRRLREQGYTGPVIALTAAMMDNDRQRAREAGMDDHLGKPIEFERLYSVLLDHLERSGTAPPERNENTHAPAPDTDALPVDLPGFDLARGRKLLGGDEALYARMLRGFRKKLPTEYAPLVEHLRAGRVKEAQHIAHTLKGAAGTLAAVEIQHLAGQIDGHLKAGKLVDVAAIEAMEQAMNQAAETLATLEASGGGPATGTRAAVETLRSHLERSELVEEATLQEALRYLRSLGLECDRLEALVEQIEFEAALQVLDERMEEAEAERNDN
ncbi:PAS domain S-box protein [Thioalkalivibrio sp.]|uniref:PAS domain S-box protein n=1 Tax=Thioalkalivibrio sp. TaxID=2093813 RepID=UPI0012D5C0DB|nr:PAS domain S-box protein [Thioalkalivibrio sp.]TVP78295.1 MAG: PAS domain S-box protein [Thioalkalivibrio sp.]